MPTPAPRTLEKALDLLDAILADDGRRPFAELAAEAGLPFSTARRLGAVLEARGLIVRERRGRYLAGPGLMAAARRIDEKRILARLARPVLKKLANRTRQTVHLGVLENQMVTYLAKEARGGAAAFTQEAMQLEAYCSGVGKVLLAYLPGPERDAYLSEGPFVALTANTLVQPEELRRDLETIRSQGWACDNEEVFDGLVCLAVPVRRGEGLVHAALSVSASRSTFDAAYRTATLAALSDAAAEVEARLPL